MSEADFTDIDPSAPLSEIRYALNARSKALRSAESATAPPPSPVANQFFVDSANGIFVQRNNDNTQWVFQWFVNAAAHSFVWLPEPGTPTTINIATELDNGLNLGGFTNLEEQGADVFMSYQDDANLPGIIELPDPTIRTGWDGRLFCVTLEDNYNAGSLAITVEGFGAGDIKLTRPGDFWLGRVRGGVEWKTMMTNIWDGHELVSSSKTITMYTGTYFVDTTSGDVTLSWPNQGTAQGIRGPIQFKKLVAANNMIIDTAGSELIDGAASVSYAAQYSNPKMVNYNGAIHIL